MSWTRLKETRDYIIGHGRLHIGVRVNGRKVARSPTCRTLLKLPSFGTVSKQRPLNAHWTRAVQVPLFQILDHFDVIAVGIFNHPHGNAGSVKVRKYHFLVEAGNLKFNFLKRFNTLL